MIRFVFFLGLVYGLDVHLLCETQGKLEIVWLSREDVCKGPLIDFSTLKSKVANALNGLAVLIVEDHQVLCSELASLHCKIENESENDSLVITHPEEGFFETGPMISVVVWMKNVLNNSTLCIESDKTYCIEPGNAINIGVSGIGILDLRASLIHNNTVYAQSTIRHGFVDSSAVVTPKKSEPPTCSLIGPLFEKVMVIGSSKRREIGWDRISNIEFTEFEEKVFVKKVSRAIAFPPIETTAAIMAINLTWGGIGCAMSHIQLWEQVARTNKSTLILEDDVFLSKRFHQRVDLLNVSPDDFSILYLGAPPFTYASSKPHGMTNYLRRVFDHNYGTFGYVVSPKGARLLLQMKLLPLQYQIDSYLVHKVSTDHNFVALLSDPPLVYEIKTLRKSTIQKYNN